MRRRLPVPALLALSLLTGAGALAQAEAERRLDEAIARLRTALGPEVRLEIGRRQVDPVTGEALLSDVVLAEGPKRLAIPEVRLRDVGPERIGRAELRRATLTEPDGGSGEIARLLVVGMPLPPQGAALDLGNLQIEAAEAEAVRIDSPSQGMVRLARLAVRGVAPGAVGGGVAEGLEYRGVGTDPQAFRLGRVALEELVLPLASGSFEPKAFRAGRIALEGAELRDPKSRTSLSLGRMALADWVPGRLTSFALEDLRMAAPTDTFGVAEMTLGRIAATGIDAAAALSATLEQRQLPDPRPGTPQRVALEGLDIRGDGQPLAAVARIAMDASMEGGIGTGALLAEGLRLVPPRGQAAWLEAMGFREVAGGFELRGTMPRAGGRLEVAPLALAWEGAGTLRVTAQVDDMPPTPPEGAEVKPEAMLAGFAAARLAGLTLTLRDQGLLGRVLAQQAREQRMPEARLREQWAQMVLAMPVPGGAAQQPPGRRGAPQPATKDAADPFAPMRQAVAAFIRQPGTLEVTLRPAKPLPFAELAGLGDPAAAVQRLGLSVVAR